MREVYYRKVGRRYQPVSEYDSDIAYAMPAGTHVIIKMAPGSTRHIYNVKTEDEQIAGILAIIENKLAMAITEELEYKPGGISNAPPTKKQIAVFNYVKDHLKSEFLARRQSVYEAVRKAIETVKEDIREAAKDGSRTDRTAF